MSGAATNVGAIVAGRICCGCGACRVVCLSGAVSLVEGRNYNHAQVDETLCVRCGKCLAVCPAQWLLAGEKEKADDARGECRLAWSADEPSRRQASSGGFVTGLLAGLLARKAIDGAVAIRRDLERPFHNMAVIVRNPAELHVVRSSRYAPASACAGLAEVIANAGRYAFVGKGCEIQALRRMQAVVPELVQRVMLAVGLFCAQMPSRVKTRMFLKERGVDPEGVTEVLYRGNGWPGSFRAVGPAGVMLDAPYREAWGRLAGGTPALRCFLCADGMAREADVSAGDPWGLPDEGEMGDGKTFVMIRTEAGRRAIDDCEGSVCLEGADAGWVEKRVGALAARRAMAQARVAAYGAIFRKRGILMWLSSLKREGVRTLLDLRLSREYY